MKIFVEPSQRLGKMRAHTATHLLHFQLDELVDWTRQAGSMVDTDLLRFDFATPRALENHEIETIQSTINAQIAQWYEVSVTESSLVEAKKLWAKAFFEDKYGDRVRVVAIAWANLKSVELCWWTHVQNTSHIGAFLITGQESVSSGVRRITAVTWPKVAEYAQQRTTEREHLAEIIGAQPAQLEKKITKILAQLNDQQSQIEKLNAQVALSYLNQEFSSANKIDRIIKVSWSPLETLPRKELVLIMKSQEDNRSRLLFTNEWNYALSHQDAKTIAQKYTLKWWGAQNFVQGRDKNIEVLITA
jgi:alanyl-tRNA synthetase